MFPAITLLVVAQALDGGVTVVSAQRLREPGTQVLRGEASRLVPVTEGDAVKAVQTMAGVGRSSLGSSDVVLWGAPTQESRFLVDGIEVPSLFHLGGYRSVLAAGLVERLEIIPGAFRGEVGRSLGGVVRVATEGPPAGLHGAVDVSLSDASLLLGAASEQASVNVAGRVGYLDRLLGPRLDAVARDRYPIPAMADAQLRGSLHAGPHDELVVLGLYSRDSLAFQVGSVDPLVRRSRRLDTEWFRVGLTWTHQDGPSLGTVTAFVGHDAATDLRAATGAEAGTTSSTWRAGLTGQYRWPATGWLSMGLAFDSLVSWSWLDRSGPLTVPPREGDPALFGQPLPDELSADRWRVVGAEVAAAVTAQLAWGRFTLTPALRLAVSTTEVSRANPRGAAIPPVGLNRMELSPEPRLWASWAATAWLAFTAGVGLTHQAPAPEELSSVFGTPSLGVARGVHSAVGVVLSPGWLSASVTGFHRHGWALPARDPRPVVPAGAVLAQDGRGNAYGAQVQLQLRPLPPVLGTVAYTVGRSERQDHSLAPVRLADVDQTHVLTAAASWRISGGWSASARFRYATGLPRTPVEGRYLDGRRGVVHPVFGAINGTRLPDFLQLDVEGRYATTVGPLTIELFVEVFNVTNHVNVEERVYDSTLELRQDVLGLPLSGTLGVRGAL